MLSFSNIGWFFFTANSAGRTLMVATKFTLSCKSSVKMSRSSSLRIWSIKFFDNSIYVVCTLLADVSAIWAWFWLCFWANNFFSFHMSGLDQHSHHASHFLNRPFPLHSPFLSPCQLNRLWLNLFSLAILIQELLSLVRLHFRLNYPYIPSRFLISYCDPKGRPSLTIVYFNG